VAFVPTEEQKRMVEAMAACGVPQTAIAFVVQINERTMRKYFRDELDNGTHKANARVAQFLYTGILGSATQEPFKSESLRAACAMFWLKTRAGWKETISHEIVRPVSQMSEEEVRVRLGLEDQDTNKVVALYGTDSKQYRR